MNSQSGRISKSTERIQPTGPQAPVRTKPHVFSRADGDWWLVGKVAGRRLDHREYLKGRAAWDRWFDQVHATPGGTVQWWTAKALS